MAISKSRIPSQLISKHVHLLLLLRSSSSLTSSQLNLTAKLSEPSNNHSPNILDLENTQQLFSSAKTTTLLTSLLNLQAMSVDPLVEFGTKLMQSQTVMENRLGRAVVMGAVKATVYRHFCAGETAKEAGLTVRRIWEGHRMRSILDYAVEDAEDSEAAGRNLAGFARTADMVAVLPPSSASICIKITAICPIHLLERISDLLRWHHKNPSFNLEWKTHSFPIFSDSSPLYLTSSKPNPLTDQEQEGFKLAQKRLKDLCAKCAKLNLMVLIDAEYLSVQPAIDYFTYLVALEFNKDRFDSPIVYGTVQAYLRDSKARLEKIVDAGEKEGVCIGIKLVRGAYMTKENKIASDLGVSSPIHGSIEETHRCYNECASLLLEKVRDGTGAVVLATHNAESGKLAAAKAEKIGVRKEDNKLQFAQLMGMADGLSFGLRNAGFRVNKYLPFGPVDHVIPYLLRRAEENKGFISSSLLDRHHISKELIRRLRTSVLGRV